MPFILYPNLTYWILSYFQKNYKEWINLIKVGCICIFQDSIKSDSYETNMPPS